MAVGSLMRRLVLLVLFLGSVVLLTLATRAAQAEQSVLDRLAACNSVEAVVPVLAVTNRSSAGIPLEVQVESPRTGRSVTIDVKNEVDEGFRTVRIVYCPSGKDVVSKSST